jgi:rhodanese-related sulfurtransferase
MPVSIERDSVERLRQAGVYVVDVLPRAAYDEEHLPGAISIPLKDLGREARVRLRHDRPVIVYCHDYQ